MTDIVRDRALAALMPRGGYTIEGDVIQIVDDGIANGYRTPTVSELATARTIAQTDMQLEELDRKLPRNLEGAAHVLADPYLLGIQQQKVALRSSRPVMNDQDGNRV